MGGSRDRHALSSEWVDPAHRVSGTFIYLFRLFLNRTHLLRVFTMLYIEKSSLSYSHASANVGGTFLFSLSVTDWQCVLVGISFYEYNPLGGGFFTGTILRCCSNRPRSVIDIFSYACRPIYREGHRPRGRLSVRR
jgi:hypothetical protein